MSGFFVMVMMITQKRAVTAVKVVANMAVVKLMNMSAAAVLLQVAERGIRIWVPPFIPQEVVVQRGPG